VADMLLTFNNGLGMVLVVKSENSQQVMSQLSQANQPAYLIGEMTARQEEDVVFKGVAPW